MTTSDSVDAHGARLLRHFGPDPRDWVRPTDTDHDVLVVGGGQAGLGIGFALRRAGIGRATVIDAAGPQDKGVWRGIARMRTLRTPRNWPEPEFGLPELSFQAWYEHTHGAEAYDALDRIPRLTWADYVDWVERTLQVPVRHHTRLVRVSPAADGDGHVVVRLAVTAPDGTVTEVEETARKVVLANGVEGTGGPALPPGFADLPPHVAAHTGDRIDIATLRGKRVAVAGAGASALDAVNAALEAGATEVHLFTRRDELIIQGRAGFPAGSVGARDNYHRLPDAERWRSKVELARKGRSCTIASVELAASYAGFRVHLAAPWHQTELVGTPAGDRVRVHAADGVHEFDVVIAGTGYQYDPATRADLADVAPVVATWGDRYDAPADLRDDALARHPYLGAGYELLERVPGDAPWLRRVHVFSAGAYLSFGYPIGDVQSLAPEIPRLIDAIGRDLFFEDRDLAAAAPAAPAAPATPAESFRGVYEHAVWAPASVPQPV
ncbi:MAG TPA: SidA/IucD/PvdA family monooxygenase [Nocardioides sp.]